MLLNMRLLLALGLLLAINATPDAQDAAQLDDLEQVITGPCVGGMPRNTARNASHHYSRYRASPLAERYRPGESSDESHGPSETAGAG